jgi:hypothetical protein
MRASNLHARCQRQTSNVFMQAARAVKRTERCCGHGTGSSSDTLWGESGGRLFTCHTSHSGRQAPKLRSREVSLSACAGCQFSNTPSNTTFTAPRQTTKTQLLSQDRIPGLDYHHSQYSNTTIYGLCFSRRDHFLPYRPAHPILHRTPIQRTERGT